MRHLARLAATIIFLAPAAIAQTVDQVVERNLAAMGGRALLEQLQSRVVSGTVTVSVQGKELPGTIEVWLKSPNKSRTLTRLDLRAVGGGDLVVDQRCDGTSGFVSDSQHGDNDLSGPRLQHALNASFPTPFLHYRQEGARVELAGREKPGDRDAVVVAYTPKAGAPTRIYLDPRTWLVLRAVTTIRVETGEAEQVSDPSDYRAVDGVKVPFVVAVQTPGQVMTIRLEKVVQNGAIDEALFRKPVKSPVRGALTNGRAAPTFMP
jgi:hypothetical protein